MTTTGPNPNSPTLTEDVMWIYSFPTGFGGNGQIAAIVGIGAAYYLYGSPFDVDMSTLAMGYAVGGVAAVGTLMLLQAKPMGSYM